MRKATQALDKYFRLEDNHTTVRTAVLAGVTAFFTIAYILILNPQVLAEPYAIMGQPDMAQKIYNGAFIGTCIASFVGTILCALYAKVPFIQAPGMGLNAFLPTPLFWVWGIPIPRHWLLCLFRASCLF